MDPCPAPELELAVDICWYNHSFFYVQFLWGNYGSSWVKHYHPSFVRTCWNPCVKFTWICRMYPRTDSRQNFSKFSNLPICSHIFPYFPIHQNPFGKSKPITMTGGINSYFWSQRFFWWQPGHLRSDARDLASGLQCYGHHLHIFARGPRGPRAPWTVLGQSSELTKRRNDGCSSL